MNEAMIREVVERELQRQRSDMGRAGGLARAKKLTKRQRSMSARRAARARWEKVRRAKEAA